MLSSDRLKSKYLCFPQIQDKASGEASIVIKAIKQVFKLIPDLENHTPIESQPLTFIDIEKLLTFLGDNPQTPICVTGTFSKDDAIAYSWQELGLNLFDLPWFSPPEHKAFRYVNLLELFNSTNTLVACFSTIQKTELPVNTFTGAKEHLQWAKCHQFVSKIQNAVGHGNRDDMQDPKNSRATSEFMKSTIERVQSSYSELPCGKGCQLYKDIEKVEDSDENNRLALAQQIAALDCQRYRLAKTLYTPELLESPKFKKIIILDDNHKFRELLKQTFENPDDELAQLIDSKVDVEALDTELCWKHFGLFKKKEEQEYDLVKNLKQEGISSAEILTCFDIDLGNPPKELTAIVNSCFGGHWILYATARQYPEIPRLVITGFRSQELLSYAAGGSAYLLKPFTTDSLLKKIKKASILHRVTWLCPQDIQRDYNNRLQTTTGNSNNLQFSSMHRQLKHELEHQRIELEIIEDIEENKARICESDVIIIDLEQSPLNGSESQNNLKILIEKISQVIHLNHHASILVILPIAEGIDDPFADYYRKLPLNLQDGSDIILRKPMWIAQHPQPELSLGGAIIHQLKRLNDYDTKYQVLIPIANLLKNKSETYLNLVDCMKAHGEASQKISDEIIKPLTQVFGGVTCYELGVRGSWYDAAAQKVDDTVIAIEFCAKSSLMAKQFIEKTVVRYLRQVAGEDAVLLQEIPMRGRLL